MDDVCHDNQIEPKLQSLDGEIFLSNSTTTDDDARLDIKANGQWGSRFNRTFFDVKTFNLHATSCPKTIKNAYKCHESIKQNKYEERIRETEHNSFNALVLACSGGAGPSASRVMKKLATKVSENTIRAVRRHHKLHPNENQLRTSEKLCSPLEGMSHPQALCSQ